MLNPMWTGILLALVRYALGSFFAAMITREVLTKEQTEYIALGVVGLLVTIGAGLYARYRDRLKIVTALAMPKGSTEHHVEKVIKAGEGPPASVPKHVSPKLAKDYKNSE